MHFFQEKPLSWGDAKTFFITKKALPTEEDFGECYRQRKRALGTSHTTCPGKILYLVLGLGIVYYLKVAIESVVSKVDNVQGIIVIITSVILN